MKFILKCTSLFTKWLFACVLMLSSFVEDLFFYPYPINILCLIFLFRFKLVYTIRLEESALHVDLSVHNTGNYSSLHFVWCFDALLDNIHFVTDTKVTHKWISYLKRCNTRTQREKKNEVYERRTVWTRDVNACLWFQVCYKYFTVKLIYFWKHDVLFSGKCPFKCYNK